MLIAIHVLGVVTAAAIAAIMLRAWRLSRSSLQLSVGLCFTLLALVNALVVLDRIQGPPFEWVLVRSSLSVLAIGILLYGVLVREH